MNDLRSVTVFCGSSPGADPAFADATRELARLLASSDMRIVYGGSAIGLMGVLADAAMAAGGEVVGVIPQHFMDREVAHDGLTELRVTGSMHERKALMADLADGFVVLPGGLGTLEELAEILTWSQLGLHTKPIGLLNVVGFFDPLVAWVEQAVTEGFLRREHRDLLLMANEPNRLLDVLQAYRPPEGKPKWIDREDR